MSGGTGQPDRDRLAACAQVTTWKHRILLRYQFGLVRAAVELALNGEPAGSDDVPDEFVPGGAANAGIAGSAVTALREAHMLADCWETIPRLGIVGGRRKSKRKTANGRKVQVYRLCSVEGAERWLAQTAAELGEAWMPRRQGELAL